MPHTLVHPSESARPSGFSHAVRVGDAIHLAGQTAISLTDILGYQAHGREIGEAWRVIAGTHRPAMASIGVSGLWEPDAMIEISGVAVVGEGPER